MILSGGGVRTLISGDPIILSTESEREGILSPIPGKLYVVLENYNVYMYKNSNWMTISNSSLLNAIMKEISNKIQLTPEYANSIEECIDTGKVYVLPDGYIYAYMTTTIAAEPEELYDSSAASLNIRHSGTPGSIVTGNGYVMTDYIPVDMVVSDPVQLKISCNGFNANSSSAPYFQKIGYYDNTKTCIGSKYILASAYSGSGILVEVDNYDTTLNIGYSNSGSKESFYDQIAYVRIEVVSTNSPATDIDRSLITSIVNLNTGATSTETVTSWTNTGHAFVPADYEDRLVSLESNVAKLQIDISNEIEVPSFWSDAIDKCIEKIKALQIGRNCITFPFFSDNHQRLGYSGLLIRKVMDECHIPYCFYGGDSIDSGYIASEDIMIEQDSKFDDIMSYIPNGRLCRAVGNHDGYWAVSASEKYTYTRDQVYELFIREESIAQNKHFGDDGTYYYVEDIASKVRFVILNTNGGSVDDNQIAWLQNTALNFNEDGWAVCIISHQPITNNYHANISNAQEVQEIISTFISNGNADVIGWFSGHIHRDRIYCTDHTGNTDADDQDTVTLPFKTITITSDHTGIAYDDSTKHTVSADDQSHAIDFVTINRNSRTVNITRLGIGADRSFTY